MPKPSDFKPETTSSNIRLGIDLGGTKIEIIALSGCGDILYRHRKPTPQTQMEAPAEVQYQKIITSIQSLINECEKELNNQYTTLATVLATTPLGIGIPGALDPSSGLVKNANTTCLIGRPFLQDLENTLKRPIFLANDADCFVLSEAMAGAGKNYQSVFGVIIGTGCGGGLVIKQNLLSGPNAICGEWGHNPLPWPQPDEILMPCYCGKYGCIETFLSGPGFVKHNQSLYPELKNDSGFKTETAEDWYQLFLAKQPQAIAAFERYAHQLAKSLASVINIVDPDVIILGGGMSNIDFLYQRVPELLPEYVFSNQVLTRLYKAEHGDSSGVIGAAYLA